MDESAKNVDGMFVFEKTYKDPMEAELYSPTYFRAIGFGDAIVRLVGQNSQTGGGEVSSPYDVFLGLISKPTTQQEETVSWFSRLYASIFSYTKKEEPSDKPQRPIEETVEKPSDKPEESVDKEPVQKEDGLDKETVPSDKPEESVEKDPVQKEDIPSDKPDESVEKDPVQKEDIPSDKPDESVEKEPVQKEDIPSDKPDESVEKEPVQKEDIPSDKPEESVEKEPVQKEESLEKDPVPPNDKERPIEETIQKKEEPRVFWQVSIPNPGSKLDAKTCPYSDKEAEMKQRLKAPNQKYEMQGSVYSIGDRKIVLGEVVPIQPLKSPKYI